MISTDFETKVKVQNIINSQFPEFIVSEYPNAVEFLKQYYISQEYQGGPIDIADNLDQYIKLDNITPEVVVGVTTLSSDVGVSDVTIYVGSTKGYPNEYGLLKIDDEIITYTGITTNSFTGCIRGFSGITSYRSPNNPGELVFETSVAQTHVANTNVNNLSSLFIKELYKKLKYTLTPGLENVNFTPALNVTNFIKESKSLYRSKGTEESFKILFKILYGVDPKVVDLEQFLLKSSTAKYLRRNILFVEKISGDPSKLVGQTLYKSNNSSAQTTISELEIIRRNNKNYYKLYTFIGYNGEESLSQAFDVTGKTKVIDFNASNPEVLSVDSTIGFPNSGTIFVDTHEVSYTNKSVNQFFGCTGIPLNVNLISSIVRSNEIAYGYENGDISKKVELRICSVLSDFIPSETSYLFEEGDEITIKNLGESINENNSSEFKNIFANSWIYNTSNRYFVRSISGSLYSLYEPLKKYDLRKNEYVDILIKGSDTIVVPNAKVASISGDRIIVNLEYSNGFIPSPTVNYDIRRKHVTASSEGEELLYGNGALSANVQNLYDNNDQEYYIASNSLPSSTIKAKVSNVILNNTDDYQIISSKIIVNDPIPFITGDEVYYKFTGTPINGLVEGKYYVYIVDDFKKEFRLYSSRVFIGSEKYLTISYSEGIHEFRLNSQKNSFIGPQKLLRKFPSISNIKNNIQNETPVGSIGMMVDGVEIINYKGNDKLYYGPIEKINVINGGSNYDVINAPVIEISSPGVGQTAYAQPILNGSIYDVYVDPQDFDIQEVLSLTVTGGNGSGAVLEPLLEKQYKEVSFDARPISRGGGLGISETGSPVLDDETITFLDKHNFKNGELIIYNSNGNLPLGVGTYKGSNFNPNNTLINGVIYYSEYINNKTIKIYQTKEDYNLGINTVGFTTTNTTGIHKFRSYYGKNILKDIKVVSGGSNYQNRLLRVDALSIIQEDSIINYENHGFGDGEIIVYDYTGVKINQLNKNIEYFIIKIDGSNFRLALSREDCESKKYINFTNIGTGYHIFKYPDIKINVLVQHKTGVGIVTATPVVRGEISDVYLYNKGSGYGSDILNFHKKPIISLKKGISAQLKPNIINGKLISVQILNRGQYYYSVPELKVIGKGSSAKLRAVVVDGKINSVIVVNEGINYDNTTTILVNNVGSGVVFDASIRNLTINLAYNNDQFLENYDSYLKYGRLQYDVNVLGDDGSNHSPIIGWAYDGNPIYGAYGYTDPFNSSTIKRLTSSYTLDPTKVFNRPVETLNKNQTGIFIEDYQYDGSGDLDEHNGRYCITPEFKNGTYAYFTPVDSDGNSIFPYFVGNNFRSLNLPQLGIDQSFDFNNSDLIRNTTPYGVDSAYQYNEFMQDTNNFFDQKSYIQSTTKGSLSDIEVVNSGSSYKVGDILNFETIGYNIGGASAYVSSVLGKPLVSLESYYKTYNNCSLVWNPQGILVKTQIPHQLNDEDYVILSGISTNTLESKKYAKIKIQNSSFVLLKNIGSSSGVTDIYVSSIPINVSAGSSIIIDSEIATVLATYPSKSVIRINRYAGSVGHSTSSTIKLLNDTLLIPGIVNNFQSNFDEIVYFNPRRSVGFGTVSGISTSFSYTVGVITETVSALPKTIYIPNHPFKNNEKVILNLPVGGNIQAYESGTGVYNLPTTLYVSNVSKDFIGIKTVATGNNVYFYDSVLDSNLFSLKTVRDKITAKLEEIICNVTVSENHNLQNNETVTLNITPSSTVGIGTSSQVNLVYDSSINKLLGNKVGFTSASVNINTNSIKFISHTYNIGDRVYYNTQDIVASGLHTGNYYIYPIDNDYIQLCETYYDTQLTPPNIVSIASTGGALQSLSLVHPNISVFGRNNLRFNLSDSSLLGKKIKFFYDKEYKNEFVSSGSSSISNISKNGIIGTTGANIILNYSELTPETLYYTLEHSDGTYIKTDEEYSLGEIKYTESFYNNSYNIFNVGIKTFSISLNKKPESYLYNSTNLYNSYYTTNSSNAIGGIADAKFTNTGYNYKKIPNIVSIASTSGFGAALSVKSNEIGIVSKTNIANPGFDYPSDKTLKPDADIPFIIEYSKSNIINGISVLQGGKNYTSAPSIIVYNKENKLTLPSDYFNVSLTGSSIDKIIINGSLNGLESLDYNAYAVNNTNGVVIESITIQPDTTIIECKLRTPINGYTVEPFSVGDTIFVEGFPIGSGLNSSDHDYGFFTVLTYTNAGTQDNRYLRYKLPIGSTYIPSGITSTTSNYTSIINYKNYPHLSVLQNKGFISVGENIILYKNNEYNLTDLKIISSYNNFIKVKGNTIIKEGDILITQTNGTKLTINKIFKNKGKFDLNYYLRKDVGWKNNIGFLSDDTQVLADNDYYQTLSYTIKSPIQFEDFINPVNSMVHPAGTKNFADVGIETSKGSPYVAHNSNIDVTYDIIDENRVDTLYNYDLVYDFEIENNKSKYIEFNNKKLSDYIDCKTNKVVLIDDISSQFNGISSDFYLKNKGAFISGIRTDNTLISLNGVVQYPLNYTLIDTSLNVGVSSTTRYLSVTGISSITPTSIVKVDDEYMKVISVGIGSTTIGPIINSYIFEENLPNPAQNKYLLLEVNRGFVGTANTSHDNGSPVKLYSGGYNLTSTKVYFTEPPYGSTSTDILNTGIKYPNTKFDGRVFQQNSYVNNYILDDISYKFNGVNDTYRVTINGSNITGITTGNNVMFINGVFQTPFTENISKNAYNFIENSGISSVVFTGAYNPETDSKYISDSDINQNQLPKGGIIVSFGFTGGLGYAPLVGASVTAVVSGGSIVSVGLGSTDVLGSGYSKVGIVTVRDLVGIGSGAIITTTVGIGGSLSFNVTQGGNNYIKPVLDISPPTYSNLPVIGISRQSVGLTTITGKGLLVDLEVSSSNEVGIGSTLFSVKTVRISRPGYAFEVGDVFTPVGLVTSKYLANPVEPLKLTVLNVYKDNFASWRFGDLDYIDNIKNKQNGIRKRFPLYYKGELLSFETNNPEIDLSAVLLIFVNGIIQTPNVSYNFTGGTSFSFTSAPTENDIVDIFFYKGTNNVDTTLVNGESGLKVGDVVKIKSNQFIPNTITQDRRTIYDFRSKSIETNLYSGVGIDDVNLKPIDVEKQKIDTIINGEAVYKSRDSLESLVYPTSKIIKSINSNDTVIYLDNSNIFNYETQLQKFGAIIIDTKDPVSAAFSASVSTAGTISTITVLSGGYGYSGLTTSIKISSPKYIGVGIGTTATASATVVNGTIVSVDIINPGFGYTSSVIPQVISYLPKPKYEIINEAVVSKSYTGIITNINNGSGIGGNPKALIFNLNSDTLISFDVGDYIYISDTTVGSGVTSISTSNDNVIGIGTTCVDNIYYINSIQVVNNNNSIITCNIHSGVSTAGLSTSGTYVGSFSMGKLINVQRSNPVSFGISSYTVNSGLTTFPTLQRRNCGIRSTGSLVKIR